MQIKETLSKGLKREYNLVIPADYIEKKVELKLTQLGKRAKIAGFRPGKIPMPMLKQRYGMEVLGEALEQAVEDGIETIVKKHDLKPALRPEIDASEKYQEGKDLTVTVKMECLPEVAEIKLDDMKFEKLEPKVDPKKIDEAILQAGKAHRETKPLTKARKTKAGDVAIIDFDGKVGDEAITGGSATDHPLELGSNTFIPGFEDQLIGHDKGAKVEVKWSMENRRASGGCQPLFALGWCCDRHHRCVSLVWLSGGSPLNTRPLSVTPVKVSKARSGLQLSPELNNVGDTSGTR